MRLLTILFFVFISSFLRTEEQNTIALECVKTSTFAGEDRQNLGKQSAFLKINDNSGTLNFGDGTYNLTKIDELKYHFARDSENIVVFDRMTLKFDWYNRLQKIYEYRCERGTRL